MKNCFQSRFVAYLCKTGFVSKLDFFAVLPYVLLAQQLIDRDESEISTYQGRRCSLWAPAWPSCGPVGTFEGGDVSVHVGEGGDAGVRVLLCSRTFDRPAHKAGPGILA